MKKRAVFLLNQVALSRYTKETIALFNMHEEKAESSEIKKCRIDKELFGGENQPMESWRVFKIMAELVNGFELLKQYGLAATIFGSQRSELGDKTYQHATELSAKLAEAGFAVITGGGGGIMEASNKGAHEAGGQSVGMNIKLPKEQLLNKYVTDSENFHYFFTRKVMLAFASEVYIFFPGGFGTLDEFFEITTLIQTKKIPPIPVILLGKDYWGPLLAWIESDLYSKHKAIDKEDMSIYHLVDSVDEAFELVKRLTKSS